LEIELDRNARVCARGRSGQARVVDARWGCRWLCVVDADGGGEEKHSQGGREKRGTVASAFATRPEYQ